MSEYRDNNNFIKHTELEYTTTRWSLVPETYKLEFLEFDKHPIWIGQPYIQNYNASWDGGKTWESQEFNMIFGCYFFVSESKVI